MIAAFCSVLLLGTGCASTRRVEQAYVPNTWLGPMTIAVAPALNLSGTRDFDPNRVADLMAVELSYADGISVIPVSRVLGVLAAQGKEGIESPEHAIEVAKWVGADAILVFAITEYDPYDPPRVGLTAQLFSPKKAAPAKEGEEASEDVADRQGAQVLAESQRVFDASHASVLKEIQEFAAPRGANESAYGWRRYVVTQQGFMQFCCHRTVRALLRHPALQAADEIQGS